MTWKYVEFPFRRKHGLSRVQIFTYSSFFSVFFIAFGVLGHGTNGFEDRNHMAQFKDLMYDTAKLGYAQCNNKLSGIDPKLNYCMGSTDAPSALVVGDSHADDKFYGIEKNVPGFDWMLVGNSSCPPLLGVKVKSADGTECTERLSKLFSYIDENYSVKVVVLSFAHMYPLNTRIAADHIQRRFDPERSIIIDIHKPDSSKIDAFYSGLKRTVSLLAVRNIRIIISLDVPELEFYPFDCLKGRIPCQFSKSQVLQRQEARGT